MRALWTSGEIEKATGGTASAPFRATGVAFDSREVGPGDLFIALKGETTDGHRFVDGAFEQGAAGAIVSQPVGHPHVQVADTTAALDALGVAARARTAAKIVGVTGSVGKTGTKEALSAALARGMRGAVHRSVKSYNNHTGVPLSLSRMAADSAFGVFEMGMNHSGELAALTRLVRPHVAIVTAVAPVHLEHFGTVEAIADAKGEIFQGLEPGGTAIIPFDNAHRDRLIGHARPYASDILTFGSKEGADIRVLDAVPTGSGTLVTAQLPDAELTFTLSQPGDHWISNAMAVLAAVHALGGDVAAAGLALGDLEGLPGRGARHRIRAGEGEAVLLDESYNANPASMRATLKVLAETPATRRIAVLGAMGELGPTSDQLHAELAEPILAAGVDYALLVGSAMAPLERALEGKIETEHWPDASSAGESLLKNVRSGDAILVKGSNFMGLGRIVATLTGGQS